VILKFEHGPDFRVVHLPTKFYHPIFNRSEVIVLTNKQLTQKIYSVENTHLAPLCYAGNIKSRIMTTKHNNGVYRRFSWFAVL